MKVFSPAFGLHLAASGPPGSPVMNEHRNQRQALENAAAGLSSHDQLRGSVATDRYGIRIQVERVDIFHVVEHIIPWDDLDQGPDDLLVSQFNHLLAEVRAVR
ncbi:hypothetical protein ACVWZA_000942 [Sphingomonas sp. UYAg733]